MSAPGTEPDGTEPDGPELHTVRLLGLPVPLWAMTQESTDDLLREFALIALGTQPGDRELPQRLTQVLQQLSTRYGHLGGEQEAALEEAREAGEAELDLVYRMPADVVEATATLRTLLDEADEYCRQGQHLLSLAASPEAKAFREWFLEEIERQLAGGAPTRWADSAWAEGLAREPAGRASGSGGAGGAGGAGARGGGDGASR